MDGRKHFPAILRQHPGKVTQASLLLSGQSFKTTDMDKTQLIDKLAEEAGIQKKQATTALESLLDPIAGKLTQGKGTR